MIIDATDAVLGRVAAFAVVRAKQGNDVYVVNCEKAVISGSKAHVYAKYEHRMNMGTPRHGPFISRAPEMIMKRAIRGMLEHKKAGGRELFSRIKCYSGVPDELKGRKAERAPKSDVSKIPNTKFVRAGALSGYLGGG